jgi:hypothetical protein
MSNKELEQRLQRLGNDLESLTKDLPRPLANKVLKLFLAPFFALVLDFVRRNPEGFSQPEGEDYLQKCETLQGQLEQLKDEDVGDFIKTTQELMIAISARIR